MQTVIQLKFRKGFHLHCDLLVIQVLNSWLQEAVFQPVVAPTVKIEPENRGTRPQSKNHAGNPQIQCHFEAGFRWIESPAPLLQPKQSSNTASFQADFSARY